METLKNGLIGAGGLLLWLAIAAALIFGFYVFVEGAVWVSVKVLPILQQVNLWAFFVCIVVLGPLSLFRKTRTSSATGYYIASYLFGVSVWMYGLVVTYAIWGGFGLFIGLIMAGVGVVPLGIVAAMLHGEWQAVGSLILGLVFTVGTRALAAYLLTKIHQEPLRPARLA